MIVEAKTINAVIEHATRIRSQLKKINKMKEKEKTSSATNSKLRLDLSHEFFYLQRQMHELHCVVVECGIAERWSHKDAYGTEIVKPDGWHEYKWTKRNPKKWRNQHD